MDKFIKPELLPDNADSSHEDHYSQTLTTDEVVVSKDHLAKVSIDVQRMEAEEKDRKKEFKSVVDPIKEEKEKLITEIKTSTRVKFGRIYLISDHQENMMGFYSEEGNLLNERPLLPEEKQLKMEIAKTGTEE